MKDIHIELHLNIRVRKIQFRIETGYIQTGQQVVKICVLGLRPWHFVASQTMDKRIQAARNNLHTSIGLKKG